MYIVYYSILLYDYIIYDIDCMILYDYDSIQYLHKYSLVWISLVINMPYRFEGILMETIYLHSQASHLSHHLTYSYYYGYVLNRQTPDWCLWCAKSAIYEVMTWSSLKKFCDDHFPDMNFKNDESRKKHCIKKGLKIQKDDEGREGIAVAKDGDSESKEIRVGKRISASKVKQMDYGDDGDKNEISGQHAKHSSKLKVQMNSKDWAFLLEGLWGCFSFH